MGFGKQKLCQIFINMDEFELVKETRINNQEVDVLNYERFQWDNRVQLLFFHLLQLSTHSEVLHVPGKSFWKVSNEVEEPEYGNQEERFRLPDSESDIVIS